MTDPTDPTKGAPRRHESGSARIIWRDPHAQPRKDPEPWPWKQTGDEVLAAIATAPQHWIGVRAANNPGAGAPVMSLTNRNLTAFRYAAGCALGFWPQAATFEIVAADAIENQKRAAELVPLGMPGIIMRQPVTLLALETAATRRPDPYNEIDRS